MTQEQLDKIEAKAQATLDGGGSYFCLTPRIVLEMIKMIKEVNKGKTEEAVKE